MKSLFLLLVALTVPAHAFLSPPAGGGGGGTWGSITGTLSSQTDLQSALNAKETFVTGTTSADYYRGDKTFANFTTAARTAAVANALGISASIASSQLVVTNALNARLRTDGSNSMSGDLTIDDGFRLNFDTASDGIISSGTNLQLSPLANVNLLPGGNAFISTPGGDINLQATSVVLSVTSGGIKLSGGDTDLDGNTAKNAADPVNPQDLTTKAYVDALPQILSIDSNPSVGGSALETFTFPGLLATDTVLSWGFKTNAAQQFIEQWTNQVNGSIDIKMSGDPGAGAIIRIAIKR